MSNANNNMLSLVTVDKKILLHPNAEYNLSPRLTFRQVAGHRAFIRLRQNTLQLVEAKRRSRHRGCSNKWGGDFGATCLAVAFKRRQVPLDTLQFTAGSFILGNFRTCRLDDLLFFDNLHFTHNSVKYRRHEAYHSHRV